MLTLSSYTIIGERSKERTAELMKVFGERGDAPGTIAHYVRADGGGGFVIGDDPSSEQLYEVALAYSEWLDIETIPILRVEDAIPKITEYLAGR